jgi:ribosomal protein S18 acetylase RimI-like enzyme
LLKNVIDSYKDANKIFLEAEEENNKGLSFYKKYGFEITEKNEYTLKGDKFSTFLMEKFI